ncbi:hypothetical protein KEM52_003431 [Ascosphaera acerosa]|nr:hypothetical protein KEM52_003431 [Ascosphaera acerosa]
MRWGAVFLAILFVVILVVVCYVGITQYRARVRGLPAPTWQSYVPFAASELEGSSSSRRERRRMRRRGGIGDWFRSTWDKLTGRRGGRRRRHLAGGEGPYGEPLEGPWDVRMEDASHLYAHDRDRGRTGPGAYEPHRDRANFDDEEDDLAFVPGGSYHGAGGVGPRYDAGPPPAYDYGYDVDRDGVDGKHAEAEQGRRRDGDLQEPSSGRSRSAAPSTTTATTAAASSTQATLVSTPAQVPAREGANPFLSVEDDVLEGRSASAPAVPTTSAGNTTDDPFRDDEGDKSTT